MTLPVGVPVWREPLTQSSQGITVAAMIQLVTRLCVVVVRKEFDSTSAQFDETLSFN